MVYYLKINRSELYTFYNLKHWIDICLEDSNALIYVICDSDDLEVRVKEEIKLDWNKILFIKSDRKSQELCDIVNDIADSRWDKAAYAHLTTFLHAKAHGYDWFWNIDADDTLFCVNAKRGLDVLRKAEDIARRNGIEAFSLDMWFTRTMGHWTFGVTLINNTFDWFNIMRIHKNMEYRKHTIFPLNVDGFFSDIKYNSNTKIDSFYVENLKFVHYGFDFLRIPWGSGLFHWKNHVLILPILDNFFEIKQLGEVPVNSEVICVDVGLTEDEVQTAILNQVFDFDQEPIRHTLNLMAEKGMIRFRKIEDDAFLEFLRKIVLKFNINRNTKKYLNMIVK